MKHLVKISLFFLILVLAAPNQTQAQSWKSLKNKAKSFNNKAKKVKKSMEGNDESESSSTTKTVSATEKNEPVSVSSTAKTTNTNQAKSAETKSTTNTVSAKPTTASKPKPKSTSKQASVPMKPIKVNPAKPVLIEYEALFRKMNLDPVSGKFSVEKIRVKNLPPATYSAAKNTHQLALVLKSGNKVLKKFYYSGGGSKGNNWLSMNLDNDAYYNFKNAGKYNLELQVDGQTTDKVDFNVIQVVNKNGVGGYFINEPLEKLGMVGTKNLDYAEPKPNDQFIFKFYEAVLDPEGAYVDASPIDVRLMRENPNGPDDFIGCYFDQEIAHHHKWKLTDNIFLTKSPTDYNYVLFKDVTATDGKYYIDLFYNGDLYRYHFEVKDHQIRTMLSNNSRPGAYWMIREYVGVPKYNGYRPTASTSDRPDDLRVMIQSGSTSRGYAPGKPAVFSDGQIITANLYFKSDITGKYENRLVQNIITIKKGNKIIGQDIRWSFFDGYSDFPALVVNPEKTVLNNKKAFSSFFMSALSKLPEGSHDLKIIYEIAADKDDDIVGLRTITFQSKGGNPIYTKWAKLTQEQLEMTESELGNLRFLRSPSADWAVYVNNCGTIVWLRQDQYKEYYLYSGDEGKFDRAGGPLEQWNFGTLKWNNIKDFSPYKSVYKLGHNELAMLQLKQVPKDAVGKLKSIENKEFTSLGDFTGQVKSLIGESLFNKFEDLIVGTASVDYVKICH